MKRFLILCAVALTLGGCANLDFSRSILAGGSSFGLPITNPVTPKMVYDAENGLIAATAGLVAYKRQCLAGRIDQSCKAAIARIQTYTRPAQIAVKKLRAFVRANDQINAIQTFNALRDLMTQITAARTAAGV